VVYLTKIDAARNMARFYALDLQPDLFGGWALVRRWGRIGQPGQVCSALYEKQEGATAALERELRRRKRRGYAAA
jgi:predicted DNA-binding WGR domain protein